MAVAASTSLFSPRASAQSIDIPLNLVESRDGTLLTINVGINGQAPQPYVFDTGSNLFVASYSASAFGSIPSSMAGLPAGVNITYEDGTQFTYNMVSVSSLTFYPSASSSTGGVALNAVTPSGAASSFTIGAITASNTSLPSSPEEAISGFGGDYGIFGAGNFTFSVSGGGTTATAGGVLGQAVVPGTTVGYVVAANGSPLNAVPNPFGTNHGAFLNGPQVGQTVTSCSPCVISGLTPALIAQFKPANMESYASSGANFPNSGATSGSEGDSVTMNFTVSASGKTPVSFNDYALLDTGTNAYSLAD